MEAGVLFVDAAADVFAIISPHVPHTHAARIFSEVSTALRRAQEASTELSARLRATEAAQERERRFREDEVERHLSRLKDLQGLLQARVEREAIRSKKRQALKKRLKEERLRSSRLEEQLNLLERKFRQLQEEFQDKRQAFEARWKSTLAEAVAKAKEDGAAEVRERLEDNGGYKDVDPAVSKEVTALHATASESQLRQIENAKLKRQLQAQSPQDCEAFSGEAPSLTESHEPDAAASSTSTTVSHSKTEDMTGVAHPTHPLVTATPLDDGLIPNGTAASLAFGVDSRQFYRPNDTPASCHYQRRSRLLASTGAPSLWRTFFDRPRFENGVVECGGMPEAGEEEVEEPADLPVFRREELDGDGGVSMLLDARKITVRPPAGTVVRAKDGRNFREGTSSISWGKTGLRGRSSNFEAVIDSDETRRGYRNLLGHRDNDMCSSSKLNGDGRRTKTFTGYDDSLERTSVEGREDRDFNGKASVACSGSLPAGSMMGQSSHGDNRIAITADQCSTRVHGSIGAESHPRTLEALLSSGEFYPATATGGAHYKKAALADRPGRAAVKECASKPVAGSVHGSLVGSVQNAIGFPSLLDSPGGATDKQEGTGRVALRHVRLSGVGDKGDVSVEFVEGARGTRVTQEAHKDLDGLLREMTFGSAAVGGVRQTGRFGDSLFRAECGVAGTGIGVTRISL